MAYRDVVLADNPAAYLPLDDAAGATTASDDSGNGHDFTLVGGVTPGAAAVRPGAPSSFDFNGSTGYLSAGTGSWQNPSGGFTFAAWVQPDDVSANKCIANKYDGYAGFYLLIAPGGDLMCYMAGAALGQSIGAKLASGGTYYVALTWESATGTARLQLDDVVERTQVISGNYLPTDPLLVGTRRGADGLFFDGRMTDVYYGPPVSPERLAAHYDAGMSPGPSPVYGEPFAVTTTTLDGETKTPLTVTSDAFAVTTTTLDGSVVGAQMAITGDAFAVTTTTLDGVAVAAEPVIPVTTETDTFNRANGRTRTGLAEAWVEYDLDDSLDREPIRVMAQQMPTPELVNGRPA